jgi:hypothetical protein
MGTTYEMRLGTLKGMGREVTCIVGMIVGNYSHNSRPSIQNAPPDIPDGEYLFTFRYGSIHFKKYQGMWLGNV